MIDREKVLTGLECLLTNEISCPDCPYDTAGYCVTAIAKDALDLLKEQEVVEPRRINGKRNHFIKCGNCNYDLLTGFMFCPHCGKVVKWE